MAASEINFAAILGFALVPGLRPSPIFLAIARRASLVGTRNCPLFAGRQQPDVQTDRLITAIARARSTQVNDYLMRTSYFFICLVIGPIDRTNIKANIGMSAA